MIVCHGVTKRFDPNVLALGQHLFPDRQGRVRLYRRRLGLRQIDPGQAAAQRKWSRRGARSLSAAVTSAACARRASRSYAATSAASSRTSSCFPTAARPRTWPTPSTFQGESAQNIRRKVPEVLSMVGLVDKDGLASEPALRRRSSSASSIARAFVNHPPLLSATSRPGTSIPTPRRDHAGALLDQTAPARTILMVNARPRDGRQDAPPRDRARKRARSPR